MGGTGSLVRLWQSRGVAVERIDPTLGEEVGETPRLAVEAPAARRADVTDEVPLT